MVCGGTDPVVSIAVAAGIGDGALATCGAVGNTKAGSVPDVDGSPSVDAAGNAVALRLPDGVGDPRLAPLRVGCASPGAAGDGAGAAGGAGPSMRVADGSGTGELEL
jgi:hypothetical protein